MIKRRVYVVGISMGAIMTFKCVRHLNDKIAAVACHIGTMSSDDIQNSNPTYPIPTFQMHGTDDAIVSYSVSSIISLSSVPETIVKLKSQNGWNGTDSTIINIPNIVNDNIDIERIVYDCTTPLEHWKMNGAGHIFLFRDTNDVSGAEVTWNFLKQHIHPNVSLNFEKINQNYSPIIYPNPTNDVLYIENIELNTTVSVYNLNHQLVRQHLLNSNFINLNDLSNGMYILKLVNPDGDSRNQLIIKN